MRRGGRRKSSAPLQQPSTTHLPLRILQSAGRQQPDVQLVFSTYFVQHFIVCVTNSFPPSGWPASCFQLVNIPRSGGAGVTGRPIRPPWLELNPLRSHQLSNNPPPEAPLLIPQIHGLLLAGREKRTSPMTSTWLPARVFTGSKSSLRRRAPHLDEDTAAVFTNAALAEGSEGVLLASTFTGMQRSGVIGFGEAGQIGENQKWGWEDRKAARKDGRNQCREEGEAREEPHAWEGGAGNRGFKGASFCVHVNLRPSSREALHLSKWWI